MSRVLFPRPPASYTVDSYPGELLWVPRSLNPQTAAPEDCVPLCLLQCKSARFLVIYIHSNFEDIGKCHSFCNTLREKLHVHVLAVEYPGYGICPGVQCDERGSTENAHVAVRFANEVLRWPFENIVIFGRSIGTGPATALAAQHRFAGLVLVCPFLSVKDLFRDYIGLAADLVRERFPTKDLITHIRSPCLIVHGQSDSMIPVTHSRQLYDACPTRKCFVSPQEMDHNADLLVDLRYLISPMIDFFGLPEYRFIDMQVPTWAFDKNLCPQVVEFAEPTTQQRAACSLLGCSACSSVCYGGPGSCSGCTGCRGVSCFEEHEKVKVTPIMAPVARRASSWTPTSKLFVEETIAGAVEHTVLNGELPGGRRKVGNVEARKINNLLANIEVIGDINGRIERDVEKRLPFGDGAFGEANTEVTCTPGAKQPSSLPPAADAVPDVIVETKAARPWHKAPVRMKVWLMARWLRDRRSKVAKQPCVI